MTAATMCVAHTFEVIRQVKVTAIFRLGNVNPTCRRRINSSLNPKPRPYLHLWVRLGVVFLCLIPPALCLGCGGVACSRLWCCLCLAEGRCGWGEVSLWWCYLPWEGDKLWLEIFYQESPPQSLEVLPTHPLSPLQRLAEALVELMMYRVKEGGREGGSMASMRSQPRADPGCLFQKE